MADPSLAAGGHAVRPRRITRSITVQNRSILHGSPHNACMQYTLRKVPQAVDALLRRRAKEEGKSLNEVALEALQRGLGLSAAPLQQRDLRDVAGAWETDRATDDVLAGQRHIDPDLWR